MGKPTGFIDYLRELPADRLPLERIRDWQEFHLPMAPESLQEQGARCMDCGVPFCHTGTLLSGMASGCPINNLIPARSRGPARFLGDRQGERHRAAPPEMATSSRCPGMTSARKQA